MTDTSGMQERIGELCGQFKLPTVGPSRWLVSPPLATATLCPLSWKYWNRKLRIAATDASTGCAGSPGCSRARPGKPSSTTESPGAAAATGPAGPRSFVERGVNVLAFGLPGTGKTHALCALGHRLVQELLAAKRDLDLPRQLRKLDNFDFLLLDDLGYLPQGAEESEVLFTLMAER